MVFVSLFLEAEEMRAAKVLPLNSGTDRRCSSAHSPRSHRALKEKLRPRAGQTAFRRTAESPRARHSPEALCGKGGLRSSRQMCLPQQICAPPAEFLRLSGRADSPCRRKIPDVIEQFPPRL